MSEIYNNAALEELSAILTGRVPDPGWTKTDWRTAANCLLQTVQHYRRLHEYAEKQAQGAFKEAKRTFISLRGPEGDILGCDCYPGCWGYHSRPWSRLVFRTYEVACEAHRLVHQEREGTVRIDRPPHGSYVVTKVRVGDQDIGELRFVTPKAMTSHAARLLDNGWQEFPVDALTFLDGR